MKLLFVILFLITFSGLAKAQDVTLNPCDQTGINQALQNGGTVYLNAGVYEVTGPINIHSDTILTGSPGAILRVSASSSHWFTNSIGIINGNGNNIEISGFSINGNCENLPFEYSHTRSDTAHDCESAIRITGDSNNFNQNIKIHDMKMYDCFSDGSTVRFCNNVEFYNNIISNCEHEGFFGTRITDSRIHDNTVAGITSDCLRLDNSQRCLVTNNTLFSYSGPNVASYMHGENGLQVGNAGSSHGYDASNKPLSTENIEVTGNVFADNGLKAILLDSVALAASANVFIHDNQFLDKAALETSGISVDLINGTMSTTEMPTIQQSEKVFGSIFDILNMNFS